jgi:hypothetical protein
VPPTPEEVPTPTISEIVAAPIANSVPAAGLLTPDSVQFFDGATGVPLTLENGNELPIVPGTSIKVYLPDESIQKPIADVVFTLDSITYQMVPTGSFTGFFTTPSDIGSHDLSLAVDYSDGSQDFVDFKLTVRPPGKIYEIVNGNEVAIPGARITLIAPNGDTIALWDATGIQSNPAVADAQGDYAFLVQSGAYKLQVEAPGFATRDTLAFPVANVIDVPVELIRLPPPVTLATLPDQAVFAAKVMIVSTKEALDNAYVEQAANEDAPVVAAIAVANTAAAGATAATAFPYLLNLYSFLAHPTALLARRKRKSWGIVYDALTKLPVDLAIVRLMDATSGRIIRSAVTDRAGRYVFIVPQGSYRIVAIKNGFTHPTTLLAGMPRDGKYLDLATGSVVMAGADGTIAANVPMDPIGAEKSSASIVAAGIGRRAQRAIAVLAIVGCAIPVVIVPSLSTIGFLIVNIGSYALLRRLAAHREPKHWGSIRDKFTGKPLANAVARIFDTRFHKLLETQVTDLSGRYAFLVGPNSYTITFEKVGYIKAPATVVDLSASKEERGEFVALDVQMEKVARD